MEIRADARIPFPRDIVFTAYRDEIADLLPYLPNVRSIEIKSRKESGRGHRVRQRMARRRRHPGGRSGRPERVGSGVDGLRDVARRLDVAATGEPRPTRSPTRSPARGRNTFVADGDGKTLLEIRGSLEIDAKKIRGVPSFLAGKIGRTVEEFLVAKIQANLVETAKGLAKYLEERERTKA